MANNELKRLTLLTGASASGKTTIVERLKDRPEYRDFRFFHFDSIGVPSSEDMRRQFGSSEEWQRQTTRTWIRKIKNEYLLKSPVLFEGQCKISFILEALKAASITNYEIILIDCTDAERLRRLINQNRQPTIADKHMLLLAQTFRDEAEQNGCFILDTTQMQDTVSAAAIGQRLKP